ncbi:hypothetical protein AB9E28_30005 [Rhizobium leguminosarum]|uniref:Uncharacterized protein n=1 Tax=Rhizobium leguminosarum TaxID=384 RepID=A0A2K9YZ89_RHILE|nr:hypothetical protein [Rhizobium leguminosarum]AUW41181.1 hypothetical protein CUJ84_Chr000776 [Rhizobium leguminosarum]
MSDELLRQLIAGQQKIERLLNQLVTIAILFFVLTVIMPTVTPIMKHYGWYNTLGWPE